jgi:hypothetical protein
VHDGACHDDDRLHLSLASKGGFVMDHALMKPRWLAFAFVLLSGLAATPARPADAAASIAPGPFEPTWESLAANYRAPDWFRDAKFGIRAHWSAQCVPEQGDWYARDVRSKPYTAGDIRFATKDAALYAIVMELPSDGSIVAKSLARGSPDLGGRAITGVSLLGHAGPLEWTQAETGLRVTMPSTAPAEHAVALKVTFDPGLAR